MRVHIEAYSSTPQACAPVMADVSAMPGRSMEDAALMARVRDKRDRAALDALARHYGPRLKAWLMNRGEQAHTAEDVVQDIMLTVWVKAEFFDPQRGNFSAWAYRLTRNKWIDHKRKQGRIQPMPPDIVLRLADSPAPGADMDYEHGEMSRAVHDQLALLSPEQKRILHMAFFEGLSHSQIAERTGLSLGTVKSRIRAPLKKMQAGLKNFSEFTDE